jgi:hypothetical protein
VRGEVAAVFRRAGLEDDRLPLLRAGEIERPGHLEVLADVVKGMQLGGVEEDIAFHVSDERVVLVGVPQPADDLDSSALPYLVA